MEGVAVGLDNRRTIQESCIPYSVGVNHQPRAVSQFAEAQRVTETATVMKIILDFAVKSRPPERLSGTKQAVNGFIGTQ